LKLVQGEPWFGLPSHTPVQGELGVPAHAGPLVEPERQIGHGCDTVSPLCTPDSSWTSADPSPA
jgi:hypothetical protein